MRYLLILLLACGLAYGTVLSRDAAAEDGDLPSTAQTPGGGASAPSEAPAWIGDVQRSLADTIVDHLSQRAAETQDRSGDEGPKDTPAPTRTEVAAVGAQPAPIDRCDRLAGSSSDPFAVVDGVKIGDIDAAEAVPACQDAVRRFPGETRFAFQLARAFFTAGRYEEAAHWFGIAAERGQAVAMNNLGVLHRLGRGVPQSYREASYWFFRSADAGAPQGMANLGLLYREGNGVPQDDGKAVRWFRQAAELGEPYAMRMLAAHFAEGRGTPADDRAAARWYRQAARAGDVAAMNELARLFGSGIGLPKDEREAVRWSQAAADLGSASAKFMLAQRALDGRGMAQNEAEAVRLYREAAEGGFPAAMAALGALYLEGRGVERDEAAAATWYRRSAEAGYADAIAHYAFLLDSGRGVPADPDEGALWVYQALRGGSYVAQSRLRSGDGSEPFRQALRARLVADGFLTDERDDLLPAVDAVFDAAWTQ